MDNQTDSFNIELLNAIRKPISPGIEDLLLQTNEGNINTRFHPVSNSRKAVVWVGGAGGGLEGPARGMYPRLAEQLVEDRIASLRLDYRHPNSLLECVLDTLIGLAYLEDQKFEQFVLVGHSFGGAVVITAGVVNKSVAGVVALSSQTYGTDLVNELSPRAILLIHGSDDQVLPDRCSRDIFRRSGNPKQIKIYPGCGHGLDECQEQVDQDILGWIRQVL